MCVYVKEINVKIHKNQQISKQEHHLKKKLKRECLKKKIKSVNTKIIIKIQIVEIKLKISQFKYTYTTA